MDAILAINNLKVKKNDKMILDIDREIQILSKDKIAILGENGAGKTTLINTILGEFSFDGEIIKHFQKKDCGIVFQENSYNELMKVYELVELVLPLKKESLSQFLERYELEDLKKKYIKDLSGGEKQRLTLSLVLESQKSIYFFDELTSGLDYKKRLALLAMMKEKTTEGTVLNVTHYFDEIENWATKILMLKQGKLIFYGSITEYFAMFVHHSVVRVDYSELAKLDNVEMGKIPQTDTGDGTAFICHNQELQSNVESILGEKNATYNVIKQNIYTTYLVAFATTEKSAQSILEVTK
ncbi:ABC-2 type transport system ATP-binding protein [Enterococcus sp. DIV0212c]|uniref:ATP-binding cassette domain-containing protein n=1 Tax=Enterococcus sp. DIV0212c TaxID=2230867 RepID=UPI001A9AD973|nr:ABC transporter ATP-binding protein [Enterococcus sp. DIV0212c]MBO1355301.1 ABC transporter ATP-binding protein [Enterococcus sp. DIV0212c]